MRETETPDGFSTRFGRRSVDVDERREAIRATFRVVAPRYDLMNDLMSMGIHRAWKRRFVAAIAPRPGERILDLAGGTGDVALALSAKGATVTLADPSAEMMAVGQRRPGATAIDWVEAEAERLPFADGTFDAVAISFGIRNVTRLEAALVEIFRVLAPGGRFFCLEFSQPDAWLAPIYRVWSRTAIPALGATVSGRREAYRYLVESIEGFPDQRSFAAKIAGAGFEAVDWSNLTFGIAAIHRARRPG